MPFRKVDAAVEQADVSFVDAARLGKYPGRLPANRLGSGGEPVLVQQAAEAVNPLNNITTVELMLRQVGDRRFEVDAAVRAFLFVMGHELLQDALGMAFTADEHPVQALGPGCEHEPFGERVHLARSEGCFDDSGAHRPNDFVKGPDELGVPVTD